MKGRYSFRRKGFTLIELLMVIIFLGIFAGVMMLIGVEMMTSSDATKIISNLENIKKATLMWYVNNHHRVHNGFIDAPANATDDKTPNAPVLEAKNANDNLGILKYIDRGEIDTLNQNGRNAIADGTYAIFSAGNKMQYKWYAGYKFKRYDDDSVKEKLKGRAKAAGLYFTSNWPPGTTANDTGDNVVWMLILDDSK